MQSPAALTDRFRERGLKVTPQRQLIFRLLHGNDVHPTADAIYEAARAEMPTISLKTVYQTLNDLAEMGEIQALDLGTGSGRFDPNVGPHSHLVCTRCGKVRDVELDAAVQVPDALLQGFTVASTDIVLRGLCRDCTPGSATTNDEGTSNG